MPVYRYPPPVLAALSRHGACPLPTTPPAVPRAYVNDLYRFELRRLRNRLLAGEFPRHEFAARVDALRRQYAVLSLPVSQWAEAAEPGS